MVFGASNLLSPANRTTSGASSIVAREQSRALVQRELAFQGRHHADAVMVREMGTVNSCSPRPDERSQHERPPATAAHTVGRRRVTDAARNLT